jgi:hypothetical protein
MKKRKNKTRSFDLDESDFKDWLNNKITTEIYLIFKENKKVLEEDIKSFDPIYDVNLEKKYAYIKGSMEVCDQFLNLSFDKLFIEEEEEKSEITKTAYTW